MSTVLASSGRQLTDNYPYKPSKHKRSNSEFALHASKDHRLGKNLTQTDGVNSQKLIFVSEVFTRRRIVQKRLTGLVRYDF